MPKKKTDIASAMDALETKLKTFDEKSPEYKSKVDAATLEFLGKNAELKEGDRILLKVVAPGQTVRLWVKKVELVTNVDTKKTEIGYRFNDDSILLHSDLESDAYEWDYETEPVGIV